MFGLPNLNIHGCLFLPFSMILEGCSAVASRGSVFVFGGKDHNGGGMTNDVLVASANDLLAAGSVVRLKKVECTGTLPSPRCYHSAALRSHFMVVLGGHTVEGDADPAHSCPDLIMYSLNLENFVWTRYFVPADASCKQVPRPRCHATLVSTPRALLYYGGYPTVENATLEANHWGVFEVTSDAVVRQLKVEGQHPLLWGHSAIHAHNCMMLFGGVDGPGCNEVAALCVFHQDEQRWRWAEFPHAPEARLLHSAVQHQHKMIVFGGFASHRLVDGSSPHYGDTWMFSLNTGLWEKLECEREPRPRSGHAAVIVDEHMVIVGGLEGNSTTLESHGTIAVLNIKEGRWSEKQMVFDGSRSVGTPPAAVATPQESSLFTLPTPKHEDSSESPQKGKRLRSVADRLLAASKRVESPKVENEDKSSARQAPARLPTSRRSVSSRRSPSSTALDSTKSLHSEKYTTVPSAVQSFISGPQEFRHDDDEKEPASQIALGALMAKTPPDRHVAFRAGFSDDYSSSPPDFELDDDESPTMMRLSFVQGGLPFSDAETATTTSIASSRHLNSAALGRDSMGNPNALSAYTRRLGL